ncbi:MAG: guanylate kinase [Melioribacteraceae bacterium]|jgi:guanylate kinase|nr:guanylate kinase [Melioribacteraceae bacterium]
MSKIFVISAPSGAGKTSIVRSVLKRIPEIIFSISATTRAQRDFELDGVDYFFMSEEEFKGKIESDEFVEWETFYGYFYGTLKSFVNSETEKGNSVLLEVDVKGAMKIKEVYPEAISIFILPPSIDELKARLINRKTESDEDLQKRFERAKMEIEFQEHFNYKVVNEDLEKARENVYNILLNELTKEK